MKLTCQTCQARYRIADDKVRGRIVKIRCKKCGTIVVADGSDDAVDPPEPAPSAPTALTGERHEQSVLFSLAALQRVPPRAVVGAPAAEPSGLIDLHMLSAARATPSQPRDGSDAIVHLGTGAAFAPLFVGAYEPAPQAARPRNRATVLFPLVAVTLVGVFVLARSFGVGAQSVAATGLPPLPTSTPAIVATTPPAVAEPAGASPTPSTPPGTATAEPPQVKTKAVVSTQPRATTGAPSAPSERARSCCPGEDDTTCEMRRSIGKACAATASAFDAAAASRALGTVNLGRCGTGGAEGHARVTFQPSGAVSSVVVDTPELAGTEAGRCVAEAYRRVQVATFTGPALTVGKRFRLGPGA